MADETNAQFEGERRSSKDITNDPIPNGDHQELSNGQDSSQSNQHSFDLLNSLENSDDPLLVEDPTVSFDADTHLHQDKPEELKAQREIDEDEIPPAEIPVDETPVPHETTHSPTESETIITDDRPLTDLETPYEHHQEQDNETSLVELSPEQTSSTIEPEQSPEIHNETSEDNQEDLTPSTEEVEEAPPQEEFHFQEADFPPLSATGDQQESTSSTNQLEETGTGEIPGKAELHFTEADFPPLPPASASIEQVDHFNKVDETPLKSALPSGPDDILGNKTLMKQTIVEGIPSTRPTRSTLATISYTLLLVDSLTSDVRVIESISHESFFVSECDVIPAIDLSVQFMNRGERAIIDADIRHGYGEQGYEEKQIPPVTAGSPSYRMKIELELHDWTSPPDVQTLSVAERRAWGEKKRLMGNFFYRRRDYSNALQCYRGALRFLDLATNPVAIVTDQTERAVLVESYIQVQNNVAQVNLFLNKYEACLNAVENVLRYDPKNVKALFRQGKALFELGRYEQAVQPLKTLAQIQRANPSASNDLEKVNEMLTTCESKLASYQKNEKEIYRRMFQPAATTTTTTTTSTTSQQRQNKANQQTDNSSSNLWLYIGLGSAALAAIGLFTLMKYRQTS